MNPVHQIGRHRLPLFNIETITTRGRLRLWHPFCPYVALLNNGRTLYFTKAEKAAYDNAIEGHAKIVYTLGMAHAAGLPK
jgi:hypothetical protein